MDNTFDELPLKKDLLQNLQELKFDSMTPIQEKGLPVILEGRDIIAQAKTGSGKTAAFGLGILNSLDISNSEIQSFVLCPTRELSDQVAKEIRMLARMRKNVKVLTLCGGIFEYHQERSLGHGVHIIVGTPGRVLSLLKKQKLNLGGIDTFVLDEADRMLDMGFHDAIKEIVSFLPKKRQSLLFSATFPDGIKKLSKNILLNPIQVKVDTEHAPNSIKQLFYGVTRHQDKEKALLKVLGKFKPDRVLVFCKTKQITDSVAKFLDKNGIYSSAIHGDFEQNERTAVLTKFSNRSLSVLVATDVAARGLDIQDLEAVVNFDLPSDPEVYVHRIGRTGRAGNTGLSFSLFIKNENYQLDAIKAYTNEECQIEDISKLSATELYGRIPPMSTMYVGGGKKDKLRPGDILGAIVGEAGIDSKEIGDITIFTILSYVAIKREKIDLVIKALTAGKIKKRKFKVGLA